MTEFGNRARAALAVISFVLVFGLIATPQLYLLLAWYRLTGTDHRYRRKTIAWWQAQWGARIFAMIAGIMRIDADFRLPPEAGFDNGPFIVVANHRSTLDILVLIAALARAGHCDLRWILKRQLFSVPGIGRSCLETGCAYVVRGGDPGDMDRVRGCAEIAHRDRACVVIFPEGTRFTAPKPGSEYANVLPPKVGGVLALRRALPDYPVLSVTIRWTGGGDGKTMFDGRSFVGKTVVAECAVHADIDDRTIVHWLHEEWRRKDRLIA